MTAKLRMIAGVLIMALFAFAGCATSHPAPTAWEYRVIKGVIHTPELQEKLNQAGSEGFEIYSEDFIKGDERTQHQVLVILKRAKR